MFRVENSERARRRLSVGVRESLTNRTLPSSDTPCSGGGGGSYIPDSATSSTDTPCSCAMNPNTWKMTKPANILVPLLTLANIIQSLKGNKTAHFI